MSRTIFLFGILSGGIIGGSIALSLAFAGTDSIWTSEWAGYLTMLIVLSQIYIGIQRYRDKELGGVIRFGTAFLVGLGISAVAGVVYVAVWETYLATSGYNWIDSYVQTSLAAARAEGLSEAAMQLETQRMEAMAAQYGNPLYRLPITFLEIFPVGLLVSLISAAILRNSHKVEATAG